MKRFLFCFFVGLVLCGPSRGHLRAAGLGFPPAPALALSYFTDGTQITFRGATNFPYQLFSSSNGADWSVLAEGWVTDPEMTVIDPVPSGDPVRLYSALTRPSGFFYLGTFNGTARGSFVLLVRTNQQATFVGVNSTSSTRRGEFTNHVALTDAGQACVAWIAGAPGCIQWTPSNTVVGTFTNSTNHAVGTLSGIQMASDGIFAERAGLYSGAVVGSYPGVAKILVCPDGSFYFYRNRSASGPPEGQSSSMKIDGIVDFYLQSGVYPHITGTFAQQFSGAIFQLTIHELGGLVSTVTLTLNEKLP